jgi:hypothetical protein
MRKTLLIINLTFVTGCAYHEQGPQYATTPGPIYPPVYDVRPLKQSLRQAQDQALELETFVKQMKSPNLINLERSLNAYKYAARDLYFNIVNTPTATVNYSPWQIQ